MSICRWCYEKEAATFDGLCQECADAIRKEKKETERFDLGKRLEEDKTLNDKEIETTQEEVLQSLMDAGIELTPSDTTLGEQMDALMRYNVYEVKPRLGCYRGMSLVAAESVEEANRIIKDFIKNDPKNFYDSWGYSQISESDLIEGLYSEREGIIHMGIYYYG